MTMKTLIEEAVKENLKDNQSRFVYYSEGQWRIGLRLPTLVDYKEFYIIEHGTSHAVIL